MRSVADHQLVGCAVAVALGLGACSPSYHTKQLVDAIQRICTTEYHLSVSARQVGQTIAVLLTHEGILHQEGNQVGLAESANQVLGDLISTVHRVTLSSDGGVNFYVVVVADPKVPGAYLTLVRYLEDVRRVNANTIPPSEFFSRTILDLKYVGVPTLTLEQMGLQDIQLEHFLSWQLAKRIPTHLTETLQRYGVSPGDVGQCAGEFRNGEFAFTLNVTPKPGASAEEDLVQQIFQDATSEIAQVLAGYRFKSFESIRLIHPPTGRSLLLPKTRLELFR